MASLTPPTKPYETSVSARRPIKTGSSGVASRSPSTLITALQRTVDKYGDRPAICYKLTKHTPYSEMTWSAYFSKMKQFARACISVGFARRSAVAIIGFNAPEFLIANMGAILADGISAGIYTTSNPEACKYIVNHARASIVVCEDERQLEKFLSVREDMPQVLAYVVWSPPSAQSLHTCTSLEDAKTRKIFTYDQFMSMGLDSGAGAEVLQKELSARMVSQVPEDVCTLVYTSGTIAMPKAVMVSHDNVMHVATSVLERFSANENDRMVSYLPLSHIAAALLDIYGPAIVGFCITFAQPDALKGTLVETLKEVRPTIFFGVPRVFEKIMEKMIEFGARAGCCVQGISRWAKRIGTAATEAEEEGTPLPWGFSAAKVLVFDRVRAALGLENCRFLVSAAAPMAPETLAYFASLHMPVHEAYGMSETTGPVTACLPGARKTGTCGRLLPGMELGILPLREDREDWRPTLLPPGAEGEICMRGRHVMVGYKDDEENSRFSIDEHGWLHSGDLGIMDINGFLRITGRAKELIKTAGGENIPPLLIENVIKEELKVVSHAVVIGDRRKYLTVLIGLRSAVDQMGGPTAALDRTAISALEAAGCHATTVDQAVVDPFFKAYMDAGMRRANARALSNAQKVQKWAILPHDLSVNTGELTATLKIKRSVVANKFSAIIETMYNDPADV